MTNRGLGRGLDALLKGYQADGDEPEVHQLPVADIVPNPHQPRKAFVDDALKELADSISKQGVLQPILVRSTNGDHGGKYELVAGERRWRASQLAGIAKIPAMVRTMSDEESLAIALIENLQREDLNPIEEAQGLYQLKVQFGMNQEDLAKRVSKSRPAVANLLRLLQLPEAIQMDIQSGALSAGHARALLAVTDPTVQTALKNRIMDRNLTVREAEAQVHYWREHQELPSMDETAVPAVSSRKTKATSGQKPDPQILDLAATLADALNVKTSIRGTLNKGHLVLSYANKAQLDTLLQVLGVPSVPDQIEQP